LDDVKQSLHRHSGTLGTAFDHYKNIVDRDEVNVHTDYRTYATELINFLTIIITMRVKKKLKKTGLSKNYSQKQIFRYLSKYKKVRRVVF